MTAVLPCALSLSVNPQGHTVRAASTPVRDGRPCGSSKVRNISDIHIEVPCVDYEKLSGDRVGETSESIRKRVQAARDIQRERFSKNSSEIMSNADMRVGEIRQFCRLQDEGQSLMRAAMTQLNLSARAYHRILKLARTIAEVTGSEEIQSPHLAEALQYHPKIIIMDEEIRGFLC